MRLVTDVSRGNGFLEAEVFERCDVGVHRYVEYPKAASWALELWTIIAGRELPLGVRLEGETLRIVTPFGGAYVYWGAK